MKGIIPRSILVVLTLVALVVLMVGCFRVKTPASERAPATESSSTPPPAASPLAAITRSAAPEGLKLYVQTRILSTQAPPSDSSANFKCNLGSCSFTWPFTLTEPLNARSYGYSLYADERFNLKLTLEHQGSKTVLVDATRLASGSPAAGTVGGKPLTGVPGDVLTLELSLADRGAIVAYQAGGLLGEGGKASYVTLSQSEPPPSPTATPAVGARLPSTRKTTIGPAMSGGPGDVLHMAWAAQREGSPAILYARSGDGGASFSASSVVVTGADATERGAPTIAGGPAGSVAVAWEEKRGDNWVIALSRSTDGKNFGKPVVVGKPGQSGDRLEPALAASPDGKLYLAWRDLSVGEAGAIFFARAALSGNFDDGRAVSQSPKTQQSPAVAVDESGRVHIAWSDGGESAAINYARSDDGTAFGTAKAISRADGNYLPSLALSKGGGVHLAWAWRLAFVYHTYYANSADGGDTFSPGWMLNDGGASVSVARPLTAVGVGIDGTAYVAFLTDSPRDGRVIHYGRAKGSSKIGRDITVAGKDSGVLNRPVMAADSKGRVFLAWSESAQGPFRVNVAQAAGGATFDLDRVIHVR